MDSQSQSVTGAGNTAAEDFADIEILLANILCEPLCELASYFAGIGGPGMHIVLSGLLEEQIDQVLLSYRPWFEFDAPEIEQDWAMLHGRRKEAAKLPDAGG